MPNKQSGYAKFFNRVSSYIFAFFAGYEFHPSPPPYPTPVLFNASVIAHREEEKRISDSSREIWLVVLFGILAVLLGLFLKEILYCIRANYQRQQTILPLNHFNGIPLHQQQPVITHQTQNCPANSCSSSS